MCPKALATCRFTFTYHASNILCLTCSYYASLGFFAKKGCSRIQCYQVSLILTLVCFFPNAVFSRECCQCPVSTHSFQDCADKRFKVRCLDSNQCVKAKAYTTSGIKEEAYIKGCAATCSAYDIPLCREPNVKCEVHCCSSDYCNGASVPVFSGVLLIVTASFMYLISF